MKNKFSYALTLAVIMAMLITSLAMADNVQNDVVTDPASITLQAGVASSYVDVNFYIQPQGSGADGDSGCNFDTTSEQLTFTINTPLGVIANPTSLTFNKCHDGPVLNAQAVRFSAAAGASSGNISFSQTFNNSGGTFSYGDAVFYVNVTAPPPPANTPPSVSVTGVTDGASYEFGSVPVAACDVTDTEDGNSSFAATLSAITGPLSAYGVGSQTAMCSYTDGGGLSDSDSATYFILDTTAPVIAAHEDETAEATSSAGAVVNYTSPATSDAVAGAGTATCAPISGSLFPLGDTTITCNAMDEASNAATPTTFVVHVVDTIPPVIAAHGDETAEATSAAGAIVNYTSPATSDAVDGSGVATCVPASGSQFALGDTTVTCNAGDAAGNAATPTIFEVHVVDTTPPDIAFLSRLPAANGAGWNNTDVVVTWSCSDLVGVVSPTVSETVSGEGISQSATGICEDTSGNTASDTVNDISIDRTPPTLAPTVSPNPVVLNGSATASPNASDALSVVALAGCDPVDTSSIGSHTVDCAAMDNAGNFGYATASYSVVYNFAGFFRPVDNLPTLNVVKAGSAVPLKFSLSGYQGMSIFATGYPRSMVIACDSTAPADAIEETLTAGGSSLSYDATADQYIYVWKTDKAWAGACRQLVVLLNDGTYHRANFRLTK